MMKMELRGRPPSIGAWVLAWHIGVAHGGDVIAFALVSRMAVSTVEGVLNGSVTPGYLMAGVISYATRGAIGKLDFQRNADGVRWHDVPACFRPRRERKAA